MTIFVKKPSDIDEKDIQLLVEQGVKESYKLEYKRESWAENKEGALEMLRDICSMANASGGHFILGIEEDKREDSTVPVQVPGIRNGEQEAERIRNRCLACIYPRILGLNVRSIDLDNAKHVVLVFIPRSIRRPYMLDYSGHREFWKRHNTSKSPMSVDEVREAVLQSERVWKDVSDFLEERRDRFLETIGERAWLKLYAAPSFIHEEVIDIFDQHLRRLVGKPPHYPFSKFFTQVENVRPCLEGMLSEPNRDKYYSFLVSRSGYIEYRLRGVELLRSREIWSDARTGEAIKPVSGDSPVIDPKFLQDHILCNAYPLNPLYLAPNSHRCLFLFVLGHPMNRLSVFSI